jgi:hypothetical protein
LAISLAVGLWWRLFSKEAIFLLLNRNQAFQVTQAFSLALMENRVETLRSIIDPDEWHQIEVWVDGHDAVTNCAAPPWDLEHPPWFAVGSTSTDGKTRDETLQLSLPCPEEEKYYCLKIEDIMLERTDDGWLIKDWGAIRELWQPYPCN